MAITNQEELAFFEARAELLKALSHPVRLCIISGLLDKGSCNVTHMQECLGLPQSTVSQHIGILKNKGIIRGTRKGLEISYAVVDPLVPPLVSLLLNGRPL